MTLREKIETIIKSDTKVSRSLLIVQLLDDLGLGLDGNGWLDDDSLAQDELYSTYLMNELERIFEPEKGSKIDKSASSLVASTLKLFDDSKVDELTVEGFLKGYQFGSACGHLNGANCNDESFEDFVKALKFKAKMDVNFEGEETGSVVLGSGRKALVFTEPAPFGGKVTLKIRVD